MRDIIECESHRGYFWLDGMGCCQKCGDTAGISVGAADEKDLRRPDRFKYPQVDLDNCASPVAENTCGTKVDATLSERGARYGDFTDRARIAEALHGILTGDTPAGKFNTSWGTMKPFQRQALRVIVDKLARICNGDPDYVDNWHDIQGYAKLVEERLTK